MNKSTLVIFVIEHHCIWISLLEKSSNGCGNLWNFHLIEFIRKKKFQLSLYVLSFMKDSKVIIFTSSAITITRNKRHRKGVKWDRNPKIFRLIFHSFYVKRRAILIHLQSYQKFHFFLLFWKNIWINLYTFFGNVCIYSYMLFLFIFIVPYKDKLSMGNTRSWFFF